MNTNRTAQLLTEFHYLLDRLEADSALRHDLDSVNRLEFVSSQLSECMGAGAARTMLAEAVYRIGHADGHGQRTRHWINFIKRRRRMLEEVIAGRLNRARSLRCAGENGTVAGLLVSAG